jgi:hypothetical protein
VSYDDCVVLSPIDVRRLCIGRSQRDEAGAGVHHHGHFAPVNAQIGIEVAVIVALQGGLATALRRHGSFIL